MPESAEQIQIVGIGMQLVAKAVARLARSDPPIVQPRHPGLIHARRTVAGTLAVDRYQGSERVQLRVIDVAVPDQGPAVIR